jgi:hypothetical protein
VLDKEAMGAGVEILIDLAGRSLQVGRHNFAIAASKVGGSVGRPPHEDRRYDPSFSYQAQSWKKPRRVVAKVEWHLGELYPRVGFIVTNLARPAERVVAFYNQRGTAEQWIKKDKGAIK